MRGRAAYARAIERTDGGMSSPPGAEERAEMEEVEEVEETEETVTASRCRSRHRSRSGGRAIVTTSSRLTPTASPLLPGRTLL